MEKITDKRAGGLEFGFQMHMHSQLWAGEDRKSLEACWPTSKAKLKSSKFSERLVLKE